MARGKGAGRGVLPKDVVHKNIHFRAEHYRELKQEADDKYEGNMSMLVRAIFDWYILYRARVADLVAQDAEIARMTEFSD